MCIFSQAEQFQGGYPLVSPVQFMANVKYGHNLPFCPWDVVFNNAQILLDICVNHMNFWGHPNLDDGSLKSNQFIFESKYRSVLNLKKVPQGINESVWEGWTDNSKL